MSISLNALEHLGINLYSNVPAVLSEIVANAWDADAKKVSIVLDKKLNSITIEDRYGMIVHSTNGIARSHPNTPAAMSVRAWVRRFDNQ